MEYNSNTKRRLKSLDRVQLFIVREALLLLIITILSLAAIFYFEQMGGL